MGHPFEHPEAKRLMNVVAQRFQTNKVFIQSSSKVVFVCGGATDQENLRRRFLSYAETELTDFRMFRAEDAEKDYVSNNEPQYVNVAEFEEAIGAIADCILIFPESPGSYAELGYFASIPELRDKSLVIPNGQLQGEDSFISRGPIALIDAHSTFKPGIQLDYERDPQDFAQIKGRLEQRMPRRKRIRFAFSDYSALSPQQKFFAVYELIRLYRCLDFDGLRYVFKSAFGNSKSAELKRNLSILVAAKLVTRVGPDTSHFTATAASTAFMDFDGLDVDGFQLRLVELYEKASPEYTEVLEELKE